MTVPITDAEVLRAVLQGSGVRVTALDRSGRMLLDPDPNPPLPSDVGAPPGANYFELYGRVPGMLEAIQRAFAGETVRQTREHGGAIYHGAFVPRINPSGDIDAVFAMADTVSPQNAERRALVEAQSRERRIFSSHMLGLLYWEEDGAITDANDAFLELIGYDREALALSKIDWRALTPPEYLPLDEAALVSIREHGTCAPFEKEYIHKDGHRISVLIGGASWGPGRRGGVAFVLDISERKRHERERREATERLQRVVESAPLVVWSVDREGIFTLSVGRGLSALGFVPGEVVGRSVFDLYRGAPSVIAAVRRGLAGEELSEVLDVGELAFDTMCSPLRDNSGVVRGLLGVSIDVTEKKRAQAEEERLRVQLLQAQKLESLGLLAGGVAHDFNNILTVILGSASTVLLDLPPEGRARSEMAHVIAAAQQAAGLTRQMLAYAGKAPVDVRPLDLSRSVREIVALLQVTVSKKVQLSLQLDPALPAVEADASQLQQVLMNLVLNAAEAIGDASGRVVVKTSVETLLHPGASSLFGSHGLTPGRYIVLEVRDTGCGMDEATRAKIFDPFFSTKFAGRGLGLAAVLGIVRSHGGALEVASTLGQGSCFRVFFPASERAVPSQAVAPKLAPRPPGVALLIDDDTAVRRTTRRMLESLGLTVLEAADGPHGLDAFKERAHEIAVVLVDMTMPVMSGEETARALRRVRPDVPVLLTSGYSAREASLRSALTDVTGFLQKPFSRNDLAARLAEVLGS